jgi:cation:H+ antiporter
MPELVTSVEASRIGAPGIAIGNIVGSNISNILLILGASALLYPLAVSSTALLRDGGFVLLTALLFTAVGFTMGLTLWTGILFLALLLAYLWFAWKQESNVEGVAASGHTAAYDKGEAMEQLDRGLHAPGATGFASWAVPLIAAIGGLATIMTGGRILVSAAVDLATMLGMSQSVIGLTVVAIGTSMPEFVTSIVAAIRRQTEIAVGNILGSNIYNTLGIGGVTALIAPTEFPPDIVHFDNFVMLGATLLLFLFAWNRNISRLEGAAMLAAFVVYIGWLVMK